MKEGENRWLVVADGRSTVIVPGNRKRVITPRIEWKIVRGRLAASAYIPECVLSELVQQFQPNLHSSNVKMHFYIYEPTMDVVIASVMNI